MSARCSVSAPSERGDDNPFYPWYDHQRTDKYRRTLAYLYLPDGTLANLEIIRQGYGHAYLSFPFSKMDAFRAAEREARETGRGLWAGYRR